MEMENKQLTECTGQEKHNLNNKLEYLYIPNSMKWNSVVVNLEFHYLPTYPLFTSCKLIGFAVLNIHYNFLFILIFFKSCIK